MKRFIDIHVPVTACNFDCHYCYVTQMKKNNTEKTIFKYSPDHVRKSLSIDRMGGVCLFNICGLGETLIPEQIIDYIKELLEEGHFVMIVTNGSLTKRFKQICKFDSELLSRLMFKFSLHYFEMKKRDLFDVFAENVRRVKKAGCSYTIEITPNDELEPHIEEIKSYCMKEFGALCHVSIPRKENDSKIPLLSKHTLNEFCEIWGCFDSDLMKFKKDLWGIKRKEYCHAGEWSGLLNIGTGEWRPCYSIRAQKRNMFENIDEPFCFYPVGKKCKLPHCYNGHSFLSLGDIPEINNYHFSDLRDRESLDGSHWLTPKVYDFFNTRLEDENSDKYSILEKLEFEKIKSTTIVKNVIRKITKSKTI